MKAALRGALIGVHKLGIWLTKRVSRAYTIHGIAVVEGTNTEMGDALAHEMERAIELIRRHDQRSFYRIRRHTPEIIVMPITGATYSYDIGTCMLGEREVLRGNPAATACLLIHEATHARLHHRGIKWSDSSRSRVERICRREEYRFAKKLGNTALENHLRLKVESSISRDEEIQVHVEDLKGMGAPRWLQALWRYARRSYD